MLNASASSPLRPAQAPNSAESTAVQKIMMLVAIHDFRRDGVFVVWPSSDEVSLFARKLSDSSVFTGLYDSVRLCVLMPNILMVQTKGYCKNEETWEENGNKAHGGTQQQRYDFCINT